MNKWSGSMITQQMYTRERRGVYRTTEGFDTVAKSDSLDNNFVKKILHPFCLYDAPAELTARGEKTEEQYPSALHLFHTESGETIIGRNRFVAADFTGQRSAFFAHNYVVPPLRSEEITENYTGWLNAEFADSYAGEPGGSLPELAEIPVRRRERKQNPQAVLRGLGFTEELFKALLQAVMTAVAGKKKLYVALDVPISELSARALELTEILFACLPFDFRRRLGVITYAKEPQSRKYIHLTFVERGSLRPGDRATERDFVFDLPSGRVQNAEFGDSGGKQAFAGLAWRTLGQGGNLDDFSRFADALLRGESAERKLSLAAYNELAVFYEIEQGNETLYEENASAVLSGLLSYLKAEGALESRVRLNDIFLERFDREYDLIRKRGIPQAELLESFKEYFRLNGHNYRVKIVDYFINGMLNAKAGGQDGALTAAYGIIESEDELSYSFFKRVLAQPVFRRELLEPYLEVRLAKAAKAADILRFVTRWGRFLPEALQQSAIRDTVKEYLLEKLQRDKDPGAAVAGLHDYLDTADKERRRGRGEGIPAEARSLLDELASAADRYLLNRLSLEELSMEQLLEISFLRYQEASDWQPPLDAISRQKANALRAAYRWFGEENPDERIFAGLTPRELDEVQLLGRRWLKEARGAEPFERLPLAFYHSMEREGGPLDYDALLEMVERKAEGDKETVYRFLAWSQENPLFTVSSKKLWPGYRRAILKYFRTRDREAFKNREFRKTYAAAAGPALQQVYNEVRSQQASPLARWIGRSRMGLILSGIGLGVVVIGVLVVFSLLRQDDGKAALPEASAPVPSASPAATGPAPVSVQLAAGTDSAGQLVFTFADPVECSAFKPAEITVVTSGGEPEVYPVTATTGSCLLPSPVTDAAGTDGGDAAAAGNAAGDEGAAADNAGAGNAAAGNAAGGEGAAADNAGAGNAAAGNAAGGEGAAADNAGAGAAAAGNDAAGDEGAAADNAGAGNAAAGNAAGGEGAAGTYQVTVQLAEDAVLVPGSMITAGTYTLTLEPAAGTASTPVPSAGTEPEASNTSAPSPDPAATNGE
ncbi:hypothetical protein [Paenibacillus tengchongensis]|uniref:GAP1-N2 domain-containing protein n=1 Tax=Paenibacillus tengchongensis TaxID=2608684 RepID=UPI00124DAD51|nr:hypothetical protein [Paenibacillus tengchongensis]